MTKSENDNFDFREGSSFSQEFKVILSAVTTLHHQITSYVNMVTGLSRGGKSICH